MHLQEMRAVHEPQNVAEGIHDRGCDKPSFAFGDLLIFSGTKFEQPSNGRRYVVDMPMHDCATRTTRGTRWAKPTVNQTKLVLVRPYPELDIGGRPILGALEVRLEVKDPRIPVSSFLDVISPVVDRGESAQHVMSFHVGDVSLAYPPLQYLHPEPVEESFRCTPL
jgi:hypothetical protein